MLVPLLIAATVLVISFAYSRLRYIRFRQYTDYPQLPNTLVFGHLKVYGDFAKRNKPNAHADPAIVAMNRALGRPPLMLIDMQPIGDPVVVASKMFPTSAPKSSRSLERLLYLNGPTSIFSQHRFNPGFAPQYLVTFVPEILDKGLIFLEHLDPLSKSGDTFSLMRLTTGLTFDIIGKVVMETDLDAQHYDQDKRGELVDLFETLLDAYNGEGLSLLWWLTIGHDTTCILLSWAFYELSRTPHALRAIRAELDDLLGTDASPAAVRARLLAPLDAVQQTPYVSAVIKETLRLHPPGGTARAIPPGSGFTVRMPSGEQQCLDGLLVYNCQSLIHTDPKAFGDTAEHFVPERWLANDDATAAAIPAGAWRPFERGPRNCIGQELANIEARVIIALTVRRYDFIKVGLGEVALDESGRPSLDHSKGQYGMSEELYTTRQVTSKPVDGMMMKVKLTE
ncbi:cytochrome P450 [Annulohypoxylon bovei var. microspora]|nr:cytochrome P450 [Annulohypoxylon bovei var. microspora]